MDTTCYSNFTDEEVDRLATDCDPEQSQNLNPGLLTSETALLLYDQCIQRYEPISDFETNSKCITALSLEW